MTVPSVFVSPMSAKNIGAEQLFSPSLPGQPGQVQLELEGLFFFFDFPLALLASSGWPVLPLLQRLGRAFQQNFGNVIPNDCDVLDGKRRHGFDRGVVPTKMGLQPSRNEVLRRISYDFRS